MELRLSQISGVGSTPAWGSFPSPPIPSDRRPKPLLPLPLVDRTRAGDRRSSSPLPDISPCVGRLGFYGEG